MAALGPDGRLRHANQPLTRFLGEPDGEGRAWASLFEGTPDREAAERAVARVREGATHAPLRLTLRDPRGRERLAQWELAAVDDPTRPGAPAGLLAVGEDVTDLVLAEARAREADRELQAQKHALDLHSIVAITDRRGVITYVNDLFCRISGYERHELLGQTHRIINSGHHPPAFFHDMWATIGRGGVWRGEVCNRAKAGHLYWVDTTIVPLEDASGQLREYVAIRTDITQRKAQAEALARLAAIVRSSQDAIFSVDLAGRLTSWNQGAEQVYGWREDEVLGRSCAAVLLGAEPTAAELAELLRPKPSPVDLAHVRRDGRRLEVSVTCAEVLGPDGVTPVGLACIARDVTDTRRIERNMAQAARLAALGELAGNVAHEVNNPIGIIGAKARLLLTGNEPLSPKVSRELGKIVEQCDRIGRLTRGLLDYCRPSIEQRGALDLHEPLGRALHLAATKAARHGITVEQRLAPEPPRVDASANELEQVFLNLLLNAIDALGDGGRIEVATRVGAALPDGRPAVEVSIADDGPGVPEAIRGRIFEPFFTTKAGSGGTGLGLAICYGLVQGHGGALSLDPDVERGARFVILLPAAEGRG